MGRVYVCVHVCMHVCSHVKWGQITWGLGKDFDFKCYGKFLKGFEQTVFWKDPSGFWTVHSRNGGNGTRKQAIKINLERGDLSMGQGGEWRWGRVV